MGRHLAGAPTAIDSHICLDGFIVFLTGGSRGLGRDWAGELARTGAAVFLTASNADALHSVTTELHEQGLSVASMAADVTDLGQVRAAVRCALDVFGGIDVLVNNAGVGGPVGPTWASDPEQWWRTVEVNVRGSELATRAIAPLMATRGGGRIINVVSNAGRLRWPYVSAYSVSKAALIKLTENLAIELRELGIAILSYDPGIVDAGMIRTALDRGYTGDPYQDGVLQWILQTREGGGFTDLEKSTSQLLRLVAGVGDHRSGDYVTAAEPLD
jgi:NAD(P)-dependent dehydrogenase (short-subunit alcohol dehydrogenase family)